MNILYTKVTNKYWFLLSLETVRKYISNLEKIFVLKTDVDLSDITDISVANQSLYQFCSRQDIGQKLMVIDQNVCILDHINPEFLPITYNTINSRYNHDHIKPQIIEPKKFLELSNQQYLYPLSEYFKHLNRIGMPDNSFTVNVTKPICCTIKSLLAIKKFAIFNQNGFNSMKKYVEKKFLSLF